MEKYGVYMSSLQTMEDTLVETFSDWLDAEEYAEKKNIKDRNFDHRYYVETIKEDK